MKRATVAAILSAFVSACATDAWHPEFDGVTANPRCVNDCNAVIVTQPVEGVTVDADDEETVVEASPSPTP